jgi:hypothetical protein
VLPFFVFERPPSFSPNRIRPSKYALSDNLNLMQPRINHQPSDLDKAPWKRVALFALLAIWLLSGIIGRDPWRLDQPLHLGIVHNMLSFGGDAWWAPQSGGLLVESELPYLHWINAVIAYLPSLFIPLHEAARLSTVLWAALGIAGIAMACRRWSGGHISYLAAIMTIGCVGLYDRAHGYAPEIAMFAAVSMALYGAAELASSARRATSLLAFAIVLAFISKSVFGLTVLLVPMIALTVAPVFSMYRVVLIRAIVFGLVCALALTVMFALRSPESFAAWREANWDAVFESRTRFPPTYYLAALLWFAWPVWPIAIWLITLRGRGFAGGWQRGEVIAPVVSLLGAWLVTSLLSEARTVYCLFMLPSIVVLAAFGVDTLRRTWYAMIDWFGILMLAASAIGLVVVSTGVYFDAPHQVAVWIQRFTPLYRGTPPWFGYVIAAIAFVIALALIQPAHQHQRRALINWAGCVTFVWIVAQALLTSPAQHAMSYRATFAALNAAWPAQGCVNSMELAPNQAALLEYLSQRTTDPINELREIECAHLLIQRWKGEPTVPPDQFKLKYRGARPGESSEVFELYERVTNAKTL